jgi:uncharacterized BrkB/YihY/UPF0761 family membrane protein
MFAYFRAPVGWVLLAKRTLLDTFADGCPGVAAQLAFYFLLALFPALLFLVALIGYLPLGSALMGSVERLELILPPDVVDVIRQELEQAFNGAHRGLLTLATSLGFKVDVERFATATAVQGATDGAVVLMLWFYLSGFALLVGAELNAEIDKAIPQHDDGPQGPGRVKKIGPAAEKAHHHSAGA